jgi:hypothetical protein
MRLREFAANAGLPEQLYVREAVRLVGDRVLAQGDAVEPIILKL